MTTVAIQVGLLDYYRQGHFQRRCSIKVPSDVQNRLCSANAQRKFNVLRTRSIFRNTWVRLISPARCPAGPCLYISSISSPICTTLSHFPNNIVLTEKQHKADVKPCQTHFGKEVFQARLVNDATTTRRLFNQQSSSSSTSYSATKMLSDVQQIN